MKIYQKSGAIKNENVTKCYNIRRNDTVPYIGEWLIILQTNTDQLPRMSGRAHCKYYILLSIDGIGHWNTRLICR